MNQKEIADLAASLEPGQQRSVGNGIYVSRDGKGRIRFQLRIRMAGRGSRHLGGTYDTFKQADQARRDLLRQKELGRTGNLERERAQMSFEQFAEEVWWQDHVLVHTSELTQLQYGRALELDVIPYFKGIPISAISRQDGVNFQKWLKANKRHVHGARKGQVPKSACDLALAVLVRVLNKAVELHAIPDNPCENIKRLSRVRKAPGGREVQEREILSLAEIETIRRAVVGAPLYIAQTRALISVLAYLGLRPGEALSLRHSDWRGAKKPRKRLIVDSGIKDVAGLLVEGDTKTRSERGVTLWPIVVAELEALYELQGRPNLSSPVFPNKPGLKSEFLRWGNWRDDVWYRLLAAAGIAVEARAGAVGAVEPYCMRHTCATLMLHASKPNGGHYSVIEVAHQIGHSPAVCLSVYAHVMDDDSEIAGKTIDEAIIEARRKVFGPLPGDPDYLDPELSMVEASELTGISVNALDARAQRGTLAAEKRGGRYVVTWSALRDAGLVASGELPEEEAMGASRSAQMGSAP